MFSCLEIKYFCAIYRYQNLSKAADELFLTHRALGKDLSQLEHELSIRQTDDMRPTELAQQLYPKTIRLCDERGYVFTK